METYETNSMSRKKAMEFEQWFERIIGTEIELNDDGKVVYFICMELTPRESKMISKWERENE